MVSTGIIMGINPLGYCGVGETPLPTGICGNGGLPHGGCRIGFIPDEGYLCKIGALKVGE